MQILAFLRLKDWDKVSGSGDFGVLDYSQPGGGGCIGVNTHFPVASSQVSAVQGFMSVHSTGSKRH